MKIVVIQGPNLNMLGIREQNIYGPMKLEDIHKQMKGFAEQNKMEIEFFQSNLEGEIVDRIQECLGDADGIIDKVFPHLGIELAKLNQSQESEATFNVCNFSTKQNISISHKDVTLKHLVAGISLPIFMPSIKINVLFISTRVALASIKLSVVFSAKSSYNLLFKLHR
jgi:hypothetical protein